MEKKPFVTLEQVEEMTKKYPTPFHLYDEKGIRENVRKLQKAFSWNKGYKEYFAVKATPNPYLMQILKEEGVGADCSSYTELLLSEKVGVVGDDIMFSSNVTPAEDFELAAKLGAIINFDDITHIDFYEKIAPFTETMSCRYNPGGDFSLHNQIMDTPKDAKYGLTRPQMTEAFLKLKEKGVKHFGMHSFLASNTVTDEYYPKLARILFQTAVELKEETGVHISFINLSGGVGIPYKPDQRANDIMAIGEGVRKAFEEILVPAGMGDISIFTELGRFVMGPYGCLVTQAIHEKHIHKEYIGLDACATNLMRPAMYGSYHHITVMGKENQPCDHMYDITGGLCENNDKFAIDRMLPKIDLGDYLVLHDTGAHGFSMGYNYNGKLRSAEILLQEDGVAKQIRRAETPQDYFATLDFSEFEVAVQPCRNDCTN
jgi:diaminopimelate decarboxylase